VKWGFVPSRFLPILRYVWTLFTSISCMPGGFHLGGNMLYLWIFGVREDRFGHIKSRSSTYSVAAATFAQLCLASDRRCELRSIGAMRECSALTFCCPKGKVKVLQSQRVIKCPLIVIGIWIVVHCLAHRSLQHSADGWRRLHGAHCGFLAGFVLTFLFRGVAGQSDG